MRKIIQLVLLLILIFLIFVFYNEYFKEKEKPIIQQKIPEEPILNQTDNNLIQNLEYEIDIKKDNNYKLSSEKSEIFYNRRDLVSLKTTGKINGKSHIIAKIITKNDSNKYLLIHSKDAGSIANLQDYLRMLKVEIVSCTLKLMMK